MLLTQRTDHLANHAGQVSFRAATWSPTTAHPRTRRSGKPKKRSALDRRHVTLLGRLDDYVTRTGFKVTPVVAVVDPPFDLEPDAGEVETIFEVPLPFLLNPANHQRSSRMFKGHRSFYYAMHWDQHEIWGATAGMVINLHAFLTRP